MCIRKTSWGRKQSKATREYFGKPVNATNTTISITTSEVWYNWEWKWEIYSTVKYNTGKSMYVSITLSKIYSQETVGKYYVKQRDWVQCFLSI